MSTVVQDKPYFPSSLNDHLASVLRANETQKKQVSISGVSTPAFISQILSFSEVEQIKHKSHFILFPTSKEVGIFQKWTRFFQPELNIYNLSGYDVLPYSGLYPQAKVSAQRAGWLTNAQIIDKGIFVSDLRSFLQKTPPPEVFTDSLFEMKVGEDLPDDFNLTLSRMGYRSVSLVEDVGTYASRGGIIDIFPPSAKKPFRVELFGETVESIRSFDQESQRSLDKVESFYVGPATEIIYDHSQIEEVVQRFQSAGAENFSEEIRSLTQGSHFLGIEFFSPYFYESLASPLDHFTSDVKVWIYDPLELLRQFDQFKQELVSEHSISKEESNIPEPDALYFLDDPQSHLTEKSSTIEISKILTENPEADEEPALHLNCSVNDIDIDSKKFSNRTDFESAFSEKLSNWKKSQFKICVGFTSESQKAQLDSMFNHIDHKPDQLIQGSLPESLSFADDKLIFLQADKLLGRQRAKARQSDAKDFQQKASALSFGDLKVGDLVVHTEHGVGVYQGLEVMDVGGADSEFIKIQYKDKDKLFIPVYRIHQIQKYSGPKSERLLDKLGGQQWQNAKVKVRSKLRDVASELLDIYVKRAQSKRPPFSEVDSQFEKFENYFPFQETNDQAQAIEQVINDMTSEKPMDRLVCGDVGFGKTEVAMRAAFKAVQDGKQVVVLAPTTVLTYQHFESFKKRFRHEAANISVLNRFISRADVKETLAQLKSGKTDIVVGTHRLLSKDVEFKNLGLLIIDEEQKFGVLHKEKIKKLKASIDTLALSATPIPRTLNLSLMGVRDLSLITTAPIDRLPTRTFICKRNIETIQKAIRSEVQRGGQCFFLHNRVQSINGICDELREAVPEARFAIAHGQMEENQLEKIVVDFFEHKIDVLVCTTIIESGIDIASANTIFIDRAHTFGLSQLYQLRGRVGRSKQRAYCYLLLPPTGGIDKEAQERLKIIQENTALGSGIKIAHYDLELRGSGNILGEDQSGHINAVGYELYLELFEEALREARGEEAKPSLEPEINVRIPAFIPDQYIQDIRTRLSYYKTLSQVSSIEEIESVEEELQDLFGKPPLQVVNLLGLMLLRLTCKSLAVKDLSSGAKSISLAFTDKTPLPAQKVVELTMQTNKKYSLAPDSRLKIRMNEISWQKIYDELKHLEKLAEEPC